uniref:Uncharacterized protein n=1 Tax=Romanomermis culicivorax TaxID=13658 RepID=A0A915L6X7_ROMCU
MMSRRAAKKEPLSLAIFDFPPREERQLPTSSSDSTKRNWEEKTSAKSPKPQPKKPKPPPSDCNFSAFNYF